MTDEKSARERRPSESIALLKKIAAKHDHFDELQEVLDWAEAAAGRATPTESDEEAARARAQELLMQGSFEDLVGALASMRAAGRAEGRAMNALTLAHVRRFLEPIARDAEWLEGESQQNGPDYHPGSASAWWCQGCGACVESDDEDTRPDFDHYVDCKADIAARLLRDLERRTLSEAATPTEVKTPLTSVAPELPPGWEWYEDEAGEVGGPGMAKVGDDGYGKYFFADVSGGEVPIPVVLAVLRKAGHL